MRDNINEKRISYAHFSLKKIKTMNNRILANSYIKLNWKFKRILLNILWGILNITVLVWISTLIVDTSWKYIWTITILMYCSAYWILATMLFDAILGNELDYELENRS